MGNCASTKKSKSKLDKKSKSNDAIKTTVTRVAEESSQPDSDNSPIILEKNLADQIKRNEVQVIEYIVKIVHRELNNELVKHATSRTAATQSPDFASAALAAKHQQENDDLIIDVASKAINTIVNTPPANKPLTYKSLNLTLRSWPFICKNQANKSRICDLTTETIRNCLTTINDELNENAKFDLISFLHQASNLTPPPSPDKTEHSQEEVWNQNAILLSRTKANQLARLLFLSNKAQPVIHPSNRTKDAYFVNRELPDKTQVSITQQEIEAILSNSTYKNNPTYTPISPRKLDFSADLNRKETLAQSAEEATVVVEERRAETSNTNGDLDETCVTVENLTWSNLSTASDFEKIDVQNTYNERTLQTESQQSTDTHVADQSDSETPQPTDLLDDVINEINNLQASISEQKSDDTQRVYQEDTTTVTPPSTPNNGLAEIVSEIVVTSNSFSTTNDEASEASEPVTEASSCAQNGASYGAVDEASHEDGESLEAENGKLDLALKQALLDDRFYNNDSFKDEHPVNGTQADHDAAVKLQAAHKGQAVRQSQNGAVNNGV